MVENKMKYNDDKEGWALWQRVKETARPLRREKRINAVSISENPINATINAEELKAGKTYKKSRGKPDLKITKTSQPAEPIAHKPMENLDAKLLRKIKKKRKNYQAKLDLHGLDRQSAHLALVHFIQQQRHLDRRLVLVITGKGSGILKRDLPHWLNAPSLSHAIHAYDQALPQDGGEGAFYVYLKKIT